MVVDADDARSYPLPPPWEPEPLPLVEHLPGVPLLQDEPSDDTPSVIVIDLA